MEFEITQDGMYRIKDASQALEQTDILELARENFKDDFVHGAEYYIMQVTGEEEDVYCDWFIVPKELFSKLAKTGQKQ